MAIALHITLAVYLLSSVASQPRLDGLHAGTLTPADSQEVDRHVAEMLEAVTTTSVVEAPAPDAAMRVPGDSGEGSSEEELPVETTIIEPDETVVGRVAQTIIQQAGSPADADAMGELLRKSRMLEQISNADEVARMSAAIREAVGAERRTFVADRVEPAGPFEFETAFVIEAVREEQGRCTLIRESLRDDAGRLLTVLTRRTLDAGSGEASYAVALVWAGDEPEWMAITREEWEEAVVRQEPYRVINRFPLVRLLHQEAVLPIMAKLAQDASETTSP